VKDWLGRSTQVNVAFACPVVWLSSLLRSKFLDFLGNGIDEAFKNSFKSNLFVISKKMSLNESNLYLPSAYSKKF
jgi:hypothetical protein